MKTPTTTSTLDTVLQAGIAGAQRPREVQGEKPTDARAQVLHGKLKGLLQQKDDGDTFSPSKDDPMHNSDAALNRALRSLAERYQASQAAADAPPADEPAPSDPAPAPTEQ